MNRLVIVPFATATTAALVIAGASGAFASSAPTVTTTAAKEVTDTTARITGTVDPAGQQTRYAVQYGQNTGYEQESAVQSTGSETTTQSVEIALSALRPGTTYHARLLAANASGTGAGADVTFKTTGVAPPAGAVAQAASGPAIVRDAHDVTLTGTVGARSVPVSYYFEMGTSLPYDVQTIPQQLPVGATPTSVSAPIGGLEAGQTYHYRLVVIGEGGEQTSGADATVLTSEVGRLSPNSLVVNAMPAVQRNLPATVTVSGRLVPPAGVKLTRACQGFVTITFRRVHEVAIQVLRAGLHTDCTFSLPVRFSSARRLHGGHLVVEVVFPGNGVLHRRTTRTAIQVG